MIFFKFNPVRKKTLKLSGFNLPYYWRLNNFGDLLGPIICKLIIKKYSLKIKKVIKKKLFSVGSVLHFANDDDVIWGSGINGKVPVEMHTFSNLNVYAVRGPLTREYLLKKNIICPEVFGDPALLYKYLMPNIPISSKKKITFIQNFNDTYTSPKGVNVISPMAPLERIVSEISSSDLVIGSSLHAIILADSMGIPARFFRSKIENELKYDDYMFGTNRFDYIMANNPDHALRLGGHEPLIFDHTKLINAFPFNLFESNE
jgi:pyruvyltransferase